MSCYPSGLFLTSGHHACYSHNPSSRLRFSLTSACRHRHNDKMWPLPPAKILPQALPKAPRSHNLFHCPADLSPSAPFRGCHRYRLLPHSGSPLSLSDAFPAVRCCHIPILPLRPPYLCAVSYVPCRHRHILSLFRQVLSLLTDFP